MEAIEILKRCRRSEDEIQRLATQIWQRRDAMDSMQTPVMDPNGGSRGSGDPDKIGRMVADLSALEQRLEERKQEQAVETASALALLDMLPELESKVLYWYYVKRLNVIGTAKKLKYTEGYTRRKKREAERLMGMLSQERVRGTLPRWYLEKHEGGRRA